ncbi:hypothetical protein Acr_04g0001360 [Actinidia rufa]|uniref:Uncharacterized protein n=1 Tax=Actinidia rufa TaxID=165716 RepID=A0A7J0EG02_9ERIC|nr:hypothetical protein Acr_04g0001360 [Actinidia rufa]
MTNEPRPPLEESPPRKRLPEIKVPSSPATKLNIMTQGDLDRLQEIYSFPLGVQTRIPGNGETVLSDGDGEVAFYEATFPTGLSGMAVLSMSPLFERVSVSLYLTQGSGIGVGMDLFQGETRQEYSEGGPQQRQGMEEEVFLHLGRRLRVLSEHSSRRRGRTGKRCNKVPTLSEIEDERAFLAKKGSYGYRDHGLLRVSHAFFRSFCAIISFRLVLINNVSSGKRCNKVLALSKIEDERFRRVFEKIGEGGHFKIPVVLDSKTFRKYFAPGRVEISSRGGSTAEGDIRGEVEGDIGGEAAAFANDASEPSHSKGVPRPEGVVISEVFGTASKKRALDDESKGKQVAPLPEAKKTKAGGMAQVIVARPPVPGEVSSAEPIPGKALGPHASVMASAATAEKILVGVILPVDKEKVEKLTFDQGVILGSSLAIRSRDFAEGALNQRALVESFELEMVQAQNRAIELEGDLAKESAKGKKIAEERRIIAAFKESEDFQEAVMGSASSYFGDGFDFCKRLLAHHYLDLGIDLDDIEMDRDLLAKEEAEAEEKERKATEERGERG